MKKTGLSFCCLLTLFVLSFSSIACSGGIDPWDDGSSSSDISVSASSESSVSSASSLSASASGAVYTIFTYNVEKFDKGVTGSAARPNGTTTYFTEIAMIMKTNVVDVVGLNEVSNLNSGEADAFANALSTAGHAMPYYQFSSRSDGYNCNAYYSRYPVSNVSEIGMLGTTTNWGGTRTVYRYKVTFPGNNEVWFYGCHLKSGTDSASAGRRRDEATGLGNFIRAHHDINTEYIVVYGDMNTMNTEDWPAGLVGNNNAGQAPTGSADGSTVALLEHRNQPNPAEYFTSLTRAGIYPNTTMFNYPNGMPLDHIVLSPALYNNHYVVNSIRRIGTGSEALNPTDHYGVRLQLAF